MPPPSAAGVCRGNPVLPLTSTKHQTAETGLRLGFQRLDLTYDTTRAPWTNAGTASLAGEISLAADFGSLWWSSLSRRLNLNANGASLKAARGDGATPNFIALGVRWTTELDARTPALDQRDTLVALSGGGWRYRDQSGLSLETYNSAGLMTGWVQASGMVLTPTMSGGNLSRLSDPFGRGISFTYKSLTPSSGAITAIDTITDALGQKITAGYDGDANLSSLTWQDGTVRTFVYDSPNANQRWALTGILDEGGTRYATFGYDATGRAISTEHAGGTNKYTVAYPGDGPQVVTTEVYDAAAGVIRRYRDWSVPSAPVVTGPNGAVETFNPPDVTLKYPRDTGRQQPAGSGCAASSSAITYDANGNKASEDDFNGHRTCYLSTTTADGVANLEKVRVEGLSGGSGGTDCSTVTPDGSTLPKAADGTQSRRVSTQWHPDWALKTKQAEPNKLTTWVYNGQPDPFAPGKVASCTSPKYGATSVANLPDGKPIVVLCKRVEQATTDATGALGFSATLGHGVSGNTTPDTRTWTYEYNQYGQVLSEDGPRTDVTDKTTYDYWGGTSFTGDDPHAVGHTMGDHKTVTHALGQVTTYSQYDKAGRLLAMSDANGLSTTYTYSPRGFLTSRTATAPTGTSRSTQYTYDVRGLLSAVEMSGGVTSTPAGDAGPRYARRYAYYYDDAHRLIGIIGDSGEGVSYTLDNAGNITREDWSNDGGSSQRVVRREFDALNRLYKQIRTINGADAVTEYGYDAQGNTITTQRPQVSAYGESASPKEVRRYNALDQLTTIEDALNGAAKPTTLKPKANDDLQALNAPNGGGWTYQRDGFGQVLQEQNSETVGSTPTSSPAIKQTFDAAGNRVSRVDARSITETRQYDALNRLTAISYSGSGVDASLNQSWRWDTSAAGTSLSCSNGLGRLCQVTNALGLTSYAYDAFGNVTGQLQQHGNLGSNTTAQWVYDGEDRLSASQGASDKAVALQRDAEGRASVVQATVNGSITPVVTATTYQVGTTVIDRVEQGNGNVFDRDFDADFDGYITGTHSSLSPALQGPAATLAQAPEHSAPSMPTWASLLMLPTGLRTRKRSWRAWASAAVATLAGLALLGGAPSSQAAETYTHDARGNVSGITRDGQAATSQYDLLDRLKAETGPSTQGITYDANGNRTGDASGTYTVAPNSNRLNNRRNASVIYDAAGNVRLERVLFNGAVVNRTLSYNAANQLSEVRIAGTVSSYLYDHRGLRGRKTLSNPPAGVPAITLYTHDPNGHLFQEIAGSGPNAGQALVTYLWQDDVPAAIVLGPNTPGNPSGQDKLLYLEVDHLNTPRIARDQQKRVVWRWDSDAFGNTAPNEDPDGDGIKTTINLRFPGQYFDAESGLHCNWHRYYDPQVGRYTQPDPIGVEGGVNPYAYVGGNPLMYTDPMGLWALGDPLPQELVDASAGFGDALLLGSGGYLRELAGIDGGVDPCSDAYRYGSVGALAAGGGRLAYAGLAKAGSLLASSGAEASAFRAGLKTFFRGGVGRHWRPANLANKTDAQLRASAGKTNFGVNAYGAGVGAVGGAGTAQCGCPK